MRDIRRAMARFLMSNIRAAFRERPAARVLSVVGPWFGSLLGQMQEVEIVDVEQVVN